MKYVKMNDEPIEIQYEEYEDTREFEPCFHFEDETYWLHNFIRCHNNPWVSDNFPAHIHGYEAENYYHPLFIELIGDIAVNVYEYKEV